MLKTVRDACEPHRMALDFSLAEQIEDLGAVIAGATDGAAFFAKNRPGRRTAPTRRARAAATSRCASSSTSACAPATPARRT